MTIDATTIDDERRAFADTLAATALDAPTLAGSWTASDVAAHVVSLDRFGGVPTFLGRTIVSRFAIRLNDVAGRYADRGMASTKRRGPDWAIRRLREAPPSLLLRPSMRAVGLFEVFVHHEDVRRGAGPAASRPAPAGLHDAIGWLLRYQRAPLSGRRLVVRAGDREHVAGDGEEVVVEGDAGEVVLWLAGRRDAARVTVSGPAGEMDGLVV